MHQHISLPSWKYGGELNYEISSIGSCNHQAKALTWDYLSSN